MTTILMVYASGVQKMLRVTLDSLFRYDAGTPYILLIIVDKKDTDALKEIRELAPCVNIKSYQIEDVKSSSGQHGRLLDCAVQDVNTEFFLTLDSDCFPVADGWLKKLMDMQGDDVAASGILWPWIPPPETLDKKTIEWKIRKFQNWENIHPACQLIRTSLMKKNGWKFADTDGHDVNHGFMEKAKAAGYRIVGLMPTRCPLVDPDFGQDFDVETNRLESVIFGDMVYHHVGATRECRSQTTNSLSPFKKSRERVYNESGAGWMLLPENAYVFKMDREEDIAQLRMKTVYQVIRTYLQTHGTLFGNDWA